ncbi:MAG: energy-coupling factor ABC transporter permease [Rhodopseudomonas palustris]|nr:energy-coupling factor ABC transporter permease [Rhodopseudomonas palustris]
MTALTLMHGWQLAVIGGALVLAVLSFVGHGGLGSLYGANLLCMAVVPALFTAWFHELVHARLPHNYFIYFFVTTFLGAALAFNLAGLAARRHCSRPADSSTPRTSAPSTSRSCRS